MDFHPDRMLLINQVFSLMLVRVMAILFSPQQRNIAEGL